ncbi:MAG: ATP-binding cassette domain-containing protein [Nitrospirae bacterium]|nr:ATP-binding cassette domain-containing protein [Nitrospirota bacterium]
MRPTPLEVDLALPRRGNPLGGGRVAFTLSRDSGILGLCGPSGSGKSTLVRVLAGLCPGASGVVRVDGVPWLDSEGGQDLPFEGRPVAYLPQGAVLFPHMNVLENLVFASRLAESSPSRKGSLFGDGFPGGWGAGRERALPGWAREVVALFGAESLLDKRIGELSGGQATRIALARCFLRSTRLYLLDEPFAGVDPEGRAILGRVLAGLMERRRALALLVTHTPDELLPMACGMIRLPPEEEREGGAAAKILLERTSETERKVLLAGTGG